jgi:hypothetical protein
VFNTQVVKCTRVPRPLDRLPHLSLNDTVIPFGLELNRGKRDSCIKFPRLINPAFPGSLDNLTNSNHCDPKGTIISKTPVPGVVNVHDADLAMY